MLMLIFYSSLGLHLHMLSWKKYRVRASSSSYWVEPRRVLVCSGHMQIFKQSQRKHIKKPAGWSCCYNISVLLDNQQIHFLQPLLFFRETTRSTCEEELSSLGNCTRSLWETTFVTHRHPYILSQSWADESPHKMCDTGRVSKSAAQIILKFLFRKSLSNATALSEVPCPDRVHEVFVGHILMWPCCTVQWVNFIMWPFLLPRSLLMNEFMESLLRLLLQ